MPKPFYITTTLPYVNAEQHIGFALEIVQADAIARFERLMGKEVFFNTGTDEHGQKIYEAAEKAGEDVQVYVDRHADFVAQLKDSLNLSYDAFARTTSEAHKKAAQELWRRCDAAGDIEKRTYKGLYCVGCEKFLSTRDLDENGMCPIHPGKAPVELEEENYFFKLSNYGTQLTEYLSRDDVIIPEHRRKEALEFVTSGLEDFSISREREKMPWGVPVPNDDSQVMYVWFDALTNYISTLGWPPDSAQGKPDDLFEKFWNNGDTLQMAGKDQVRFQSIMWQAMLMSAGMKNTDRIFYHGFINSGGQRMSKSFGNVISPFDLVERYGTDATRYLLLRHVHPTDDTDITWERLDEWYTAHLVNGLGNVVARVMKLAETHLDTPVAPEDKDFIAREIYLIKGYDFQEALDTVWLAIGATDLRMQETKPFRVIKENQEKGKEEIEFLTNRLYQIAKGLEAFMPNTTEKIKEAVLANKKPDNLFPRLVEAGSEGDSD